MDKYLLHPPRPVPADKETPSRKRPFEDQAQPDTSKKNRLDDTLLNSNYYSPLNMNDNGDYTSSILKQTRVRKPRIPPITLHQELKNPKDTYEKIQSWAAKPVYFKKSGDVRYIYATEKDDFIKIKEQLNLIKFQWTSHKAEDDLYKKLVLKGLDRFYTDVEVYDDLKKQLESVVKVKQCTRTDEDGQTIPLGVYIVYFEWNTMLSVPKKVIKYCCHHKISWEYLRKNRRNSLKQCFNCQRFGHHSSECGLQNRCVKCVEHHKQGECKKIKGTDDPVCCNCGKNHPANYRGCEKAQQYLKNVRKPSQPRVSNDNKRKVSNNGAAFSNQVNRKLTFNSALKQSNQSRTPKSVKKDATSTTAPGKGHVKTPKQPQVVSSRSGFPGWGQETRGTSEVSNNIDLVSGTLSGAQGFSFICNEIDALFGVPFDVLMDTVNAFMPVYRECTGAAQKKLLLIEFLCKISR